MNYGSKLASFTHGKGTMSLLFGGYERCHNKEEVIEQIRYNKEADPNTAHPPSFAQKDRAMRFLGKKQRKKCTVYKKHCSDCYSFFFRSNLSIAVFSIPLQ